MCLVLCIFSLFLSVRLVYKTGMDAESISMDPESRAGSTNCEVISSSNAAGNFVPFKKRLKALFRGSLDNLIAQIG